MTKMCWKIKRRIMCEKHGYPLSECRYVNVREYIAGRLHTIVNGTKEENNVPRNDFAFLLDKNET